VRETMLWITDVCNGDLRRTSRTQEISSGILTIEDAINSFDWVQGNRKAALPGD
jgi:hypothetical protein